MAELYDDPRLQGLISSLPHMLSEADMLKSGDKTIWAKKIKESSDKIEELELLLESRRVDRLNQDYVQT